MREEGRREEEEEESNFKLKATLFLTLTESDERWSGKLRWDSREDEGDGRVRDIEMRLKGFNETEVEA